MNNFNVDYDQLSRFGQLTQPRPSTKIEPKSEIEMIWQDLNEGMNNKAMEKMMQVIQDLQKRIDVLEEKNANHGDSKI